MFEKSVHRRGVNNARKRVKYLHYMPNGSLVGLSGTANDLFRYIQMRIATSEYCEDSKYYLYPNIEFRDRFNSYLTTNGGNEISEPTFNRALRELKQRNVIISISKGKYLYNFKDYAHVGNNDQYKFDLLKYDIITILDKVKNKQ